MKQVRLYIFGAMDVHGQCGNFKALQYMTPDFAKAFHWQSFKSISAFPICLHINRTRLEKLSWTVDETIYWIM